MSKDKNPLVNDQALIAILEKLSTCVQQLMNVCKATMQDPKMEAHAKTWWSSRALPCIHQQHLHLPRDLMPDVCLSSSQME